MSSAGLHRPVAGLVCLADEIEIPVEPDSNRRIHERLKASDLQWLRSARLKYGAELRVIDISAGGMLLETDAALAPDSSVVVELTAAGSPILIPSRVLRCRAASLGEVRSYQGAFAFKRPLAIRELTATGKPVAQAPAAVAVRPPGATNTLGWQKVIARFKDGQVISGYTNDFHPTKPQLHVTPEPRHGQSRLIPLSKLKALFFGTGVRWGSHARRTQGLRGSTAGPESRSDVLRR